MRKQEVDARVQAAIENLQAGRTVEDDAGIEFKGDWPDPTKKARQLAGAANSLRGVPLIYVIGVDDRTGAVTVPSKTEPPEWYAKAKKVFDQVAPELLWTQTVFVGDGSDSVLALVFDTSDFPYVVNAENRREVPLRVASGTESAHRNQLVRMFEPSLRPPNLAFTECTVRVDWDDTPHFKIGEPSPVKRKLTLTMAIHARIFVEHFGTQPTTLPIRDMRARFACDDDDVEHRFKVRVRHLGSTGFPGFVRAGEAPPPEPVPPQFGVYARDQHVIATAPGEFSIETTSQVQQATAPDSEMAELRNQFASIRAARVDLAVRVVGVEQSIRLSAPLLRSKAAAAPTEKAHLRGELEVSQQLGHWELLAEDWDPWGE